MSLLRTRSFTTSARWVLAWCASYTRDLPEDVAAARRDELASDLHEHALWADEAGWSAGHLRRDIVRRLVTGSIHDVTWRSHQLGRTARTDARHAATVRTAQRITGWMLALGITLTLVGGYTYVRTVRAIVVDDLRGAPLLAMLLGLLTSLALLGTVLTAGRRTRVVGAIALAPPALLLGSATVTALSRISATGWQVISWADHLTATAGSLGLLATGVGAASLFGLAAAAIWWWPPRRPSNPAPTSADQLPTSS